MKAGTGGQSNEVVASPDYDTKRKDPARIVLHDEPQESYMSYTEPGSESDGAITNIQNCELNSNVSVTQFPNHGYTSGYATGTNNKSIKKKSFVRTNSKIEIVETKNMSKVSKNSKERSKVCISPKIDYMSPSESDHMNINRVVRRKGAETRSNLSSSGLSSISRRSMGSAGERYDPMIASIDTRKFYHPHASETNVWANFSNRTFEILELVYFFFVDLLEGIVSLIARFFCGFFYIVAVSI